jgi:hypothetical protein
VQLIKRGIEMESWNCVVVCRRMRGGVDEVLVQWECSWVPAEEAPPGDIVRVLMRRVVGQKHEMLVQWACTWEPVGGVDAAAVTDYVGDVVVVEDADAAKAVKQTVVGRPAQKRRRNNRW